MLVHELETGMQSIQAQARRWCIKAGLIALLILLALALFIVPAHAAGGSGITPVTMAPQPTDGAYAILDATGKGAVHYPELEAASYTVCLPGFECLGGSRQYSGEAYEILLYEDGSGWLTLLDGTATQFCMVGWDCDTQLPDPCEADPQALGCTTEEEPPIVAPVCTSEWCGKLFLPAVMVQHTVLGDGTGKVCSRPDCTQ